MSCTCARRDWPRTRTPRIAPVEPIESTDPALPIERTDPVEPIDNTDPDEPMDNSEPALPMLRTDAKLKSEPMERAEYELRTLFQLELRAMVCVTARIGLFMGRVSS